MIREQEFVGQGGSWRGAGSPGFPAGSGADCFLSACERSGSILIAVLKLKAR